MRKFTLDGRDYHSIGLLTDLTLLELTYYANKLSLTNKEFDDIANLLLRQRLTIPNVGVIIRTA